MDLIFAVFKGNGIAVASETETELSPGSIVIVPRGERRGIRATTDMEAIHTVSPVPTESDHEEVMRKVSKGIFD